MPRGSSARTGAVPTGAPRLGEHTHEVLSELLGLDDGEIRALADAGVI